MRINHAAEKRMYERIFFSLLRRNTHVLPAAFDALGYTSEEGDIYIGFDHPLVMGLKVPERPVLRMGVFAHETLHQFFTDFDAFHQVKVGMSWAEEQIFMQFANLIEDTAIEYFAPTAFGGNMLSALRYSIQVIYDNDTGLGKDEHAFAELIHALILFGDMGMVKGEFKYPEAMEAFLRIAPGYNRMVKEPSSRIRIEMAKQWMEETRPLWETQMGRGEGSDPENFLKETPQKSVMQPETGGTKPEISEEELKEELSAAESMPESESAKRREELLKKLEDAGEGEEATEAMKQQAKEAGSESKDAPEESGEKTMQETVRGIAKDIAKEQRAIAKERATASAKVDKIRQELKDIVVPDYSGVVCENILMSPSKDYEKVLAPLQSKINMLSSTMKKIFAQDYDATLRSTSGRYNMKRASRQTSIKMFDKRKEKREVDNLAVFLLVDESGSMCNKYMDAREAAVLLAESLYRLHIPCYVMGFTADETASQVATHRHFLPWNAPKTQLAALYHIDARNNNDDPFSIAFATEQLRKRPEVHKILFVISDGQPAAHRLRYGGDEISETAAVVRKAKKIADVLAVGIKTDKEATQAMYGPESCIIIDSAKELPNLLIAQLKRIVKKY